MKDIPPQFLDDLQALRKEFLWDGKWLKVKHSMLIWNYDEGGFKDVDLPSKIVGGILVGLSNGILMEYSISSIEVPFWEFR